MPRLARGEGKPPRSAEARRWWLAPRELRACGGRSELEPSGVLFLLAAMWLADMVRVRVTMVNCDRQCRGWNSVHLSVRPGQMLADRMPADVQCRGAGYTGDGSCVCTRVFSCSPSCPKSVYVSDAVGTGTLACASKESSMTVRGRAGRCRGCAVL
jgi:hypothetical protein